MPHPVGTLEAPLHHLIGIGFKAAAVLIFATMAAAVKYLADDYPPGQLIFARSFLGLVPLVIWLVLRGEFPTALRTGRPLGHAWRAVIGTGAMMVYFSALARLPLPDVTAIVFASPLITLVLATVLLDEKVGVYRWSAVGVGFSGVLLILWPHLGGGVSISDGAGVGAVLALMTALAMALVMIQLRNLTRTETTGAIVFYFSVLGSLLALATLPLGWTVPDWRDGAVLLVLGLAGGVGQILLTQAYRFAPASVVAPFEYTSMLWALVLGYVIFSDVPQAIVLVGAAVVILAGLFVIHRERRLGIADAARPPSGPAA